jgi:hypothetical protein
LSQETLDQYRRTTGIERLKLSLTMTEENISALFVGSPERAQPSTSTSPGSLHARVLS